MAISALPASQTNQVPKKSETTKSKTTERQRGSGGIYLRGNTWWIRYSHRGKTIRESSGSADAVIAQKRLDKRMKELWAERQGLQAFAPRAEKVYVDELLDALEKEYTRGGGRALRQFKTHLKPIREAFGDLRAVHVTTRRIDAYIDRRLEDDGRAPGTINRETQLLGQAFKLGIKCGEVITAPYIRRLSENNVRRGFFERAEFDAVVAALPDYLRDFTRFAYMTAWRKGQVASLMWADVDRSAGVIIARAEHVKNGRAHKIVLEGELKNIIERRWASRDYESPTGPGISQYVFHRNGEPVRDPRRAWAFACKAAGLMKPKLDKQGKPVIEIINGKETVVMKPTRLFHDLRRSGVRNMVRAGVRETVAMAISGHRTRAIFDRYNITSDDDPRQAVRQTQEHLNTQPAASNVVAITKNQH